MQEIAWSRSDGWPRQASFWFGGLGLVGLCLADRAGWVAVADVLIVCGALLAWVRRTLRISGGHLLQGWGWALPGGRVWTARSVAIRLPKVEAVWVEPRMWHYKRFAQMFAVVVGTPGTLSRVVVDDEFVDSETARQRAALIALHLEVALET